MSYNLVVFLKEIFEKLNFEKKVVLSNGLFFSTAMILYEFASLVVYSQAVDVLQEL